MTSSQPTVSPLRQRMIDDMRMRQLSAKTQASYLRIVREFARYLGRGNLPDLRRAWSTWGCPLRLVDRERRLRRFARFAPIHAVPPRVTFWFLAAPDRDWPKPLFVNVFVHRLQLSCGRRRKDRKA